MPTKKASSFASKLKALREAAGLTQAKLAESAGMHLHGLTKLEQGDREPAWATVQALAKALGVTCEAFADTDVSPEPEPPTATKKKRGRKAKGAT